MILSVTIPAPDTRAWYPVHVPSRDAQWVIGTIVAAAIALSVQMAGIRSDHSEIRTDMRRMDDRLRTVEIAFAKVDQRIDDLRDHVDRRFDDLRDLITELLD